MKAILLEAPDGHLSEAVKQSIVDWYEPPTALQVLRTTDIAVHSGGASEFSMGVLDTLLMIAMKAENITYEDLIKHADWRNAND